MAPPPPPRKASPDPRSAAERTRWLRILALPPTATDDAMRRAAERLRDALQRQPDAPDGAAMGPASPERGAGQEAEIADLEALLAALTEESRGVPDPRAERDRRALAGVLLATLLVGLLLVFSVRPETAEDRLATDDAIPVFTTESRLLVLGDLGGATLRVFDADRTEVLVERPATGAVVALRPGRYALEVEQPGCAERWTRSLFFEAGATRRVEPMLCEQAGRLVVRSNLRGDRLSIDGEEVGSTGPRRHALSAGPHDVTIEKPGYAAFTERVQIQPGETLEIAAELLPDPDSSTETSRRLDFSYAAPIPPIDTATPEPFDLDGLKNELKPPSVTGRRSQLFARNGLDDLPDGGSTRWHDRVRATFLGRFDADRSGRIDSIEENEAVTCDYWKATESSFEEGGLGLSMARYYGFDGSEWHPNALGFDRGVRDAAYRRMRKCGLQA